MRVKRSLVAALMAAPLMALPLAAAPAAPAPIATEQVTGNLLTLQPHVEYTRATLTIRGREDIRIVREFGPGGAISAPLLTAEGATLPDGLYEYTLSFSFGDEQGEMSEMRREAQTPRSMNGIFFVQDGTAISRGERRAALATQRSELQAAAAPGGPGTEALNVDDSVYIQDTAGDDVTILLMGSSSNGLWDIYNDDGVFRISPFGPSGPTVAIDGSGLGVGTANPLSELHVVGSDGEIRLTGSGQDWIIDGDDDGIYILASGATLPIGLLEPTGIGTLSPDADLHVTNADGAGNTAVRFTNGGTTWSNAVRDSDGNFVFNRIGTGGAEFTVRERLDGNGPTLDIQGSVQATNVNFTSSREVKTGFEALQPVDVLAKVGDLPVSSWRYVWEDASARHVGPVAEDFQRLFGLGDGKHISTVDAQGVTFAAIQGLKQQLDAKHAELAQVRETNAALEARLQAIEARLMSESP